MSLPFSVLLSVYFKESPAYLEQSLSSVLIDQTVPPSEVVLVCDGVLTEELESVIFNYQSRFPDVLKVTRKDNGGLGKALSFGMNFCTNELIARMDTDDICYPDRFEKQLAFFENHPEYDVVGGLLEEFVDSVQKPVSIRAVPETHAGIVSFSKKKNPINHPTVMFRKSAVERAGSYQHFPLFEDYFLWVRMIRSGSLFYNIQEPLIHFRSSEDMYKRRGGLRYAIEEVRFEYTLLKIRHINFFQFLYNSSVRFIVHIIPNSLRARIYKKYLRNSVN